MDPETLPVLPSLALIVHPHNRLMSQTRVLYVRTFDEFLEQIDLLEAPDRPHELN